MSPSNFVDSANSDAEVCGDGASYFAASKAAANLNDMGLRQFGAVTSFSTNRAPSARGVLHVLFRSAYTEVLRVYALGIVALVQNKHPLWDRGTKNLPRDNVGAFRFASDAKASVSRWKKRPAPLPATTGSDCYVGQELTFGPTVTRPAPCRLKSAAALLAVPNTDAPSVSNNHACKRALFVPNHQVAAL